MTTTNLGNQLNQITCNARHALFDQGELAQLSYGALDTAARVMQQSDEEVVTISFPVGWKPDKTAIESAREYRKDELLRRYQFLAFHQLSVNGLVQLVTIVEAMLGDAIRAIVQRYPQKLGAKRTIKLQTVLEAQSIDEVHLRATDALVNELSYKSPAEFIDFFDAIASVNLMECPAFQRYLEIKASRDIFIHNMGTANATYERKAGAHARVRDGMRLPADTAYFLESYEWSLQLTEWLEKQFHEHWHSSEREDRDKQQIEMELPSGD